MHKHYISIFSSFTHNGENFTSIREVAKATIAELNAFDTMTQLN